MSTADDPDLPAGADDGGREVASPIPRLPTPQEQLAADGALPEGLRQAIAEHPPIRPDGTDPAARCHACGEMVQYDRPEGPKTARYCPACKIWIHRDCASRERTLARRRCPECSQPIKQLYLLYCPKCEAYVNEENLSGTEKLPRCPACTRHLWLVPGRTVGCGESFLSFVVGCVASVGLAMLAAAVSPSPLMYVAGALAAAIFLFAALPTMVIGAKGVLVMMFTQEASFPIPGERPMPLARAEAYLSQPFLRRLLLAPLAVIRQSIVAFFTILVFAVVGLGLLFIQYLLREGCRAATR